MIQAANVSLNDLSKPGVTFRLLEPVARADDPAIDAILARCHDVFASQADEEAAIELQRR